MKLLTVNEKLLKAAKLSGTVTANWTLPAVVTCPFAGACSVGCYATKGSYSWPAVKAAHARNLEACKAPGFEVDILSDVDSLTKKAKGAKVYVRIHDSGDFYNAEYLARWARIATARPSVAFYAYTKSLPLVRQANKAGLIPENMTFVFSEGGKLDSSIDKAAERHTRTFATVGELWAAGYHNASGNDLIAADPSVLKVGLVYHGSQAGAKAWNVAWAGKDAYTVAKQSPALKASLN